MPKKIDKYPLRAVFCLYWSKIAPALRLPKAVGHRLQSGYPFTPKRVPLKLDRQSLLVDRWRKLRALLPSKVPTCDHRHKTDFRKIKKNEKVTAAVWFAKITKSDYLSLVNHPKSPNRDQAAAITFLDQAAANTF